MSWSKVTPQIEPRMEALRWWANLTLLQKVRLVWANWGELKANCRGTDFLIVETENEH